MDIIAKVKDIAEPHAANLGYELVDVTFQKGSKHDLLSIFIYKKEGISLDDCADMTHAIEDELNQADVIQGAYYLEVSSPGLDRPLKTQDDYRRNLGNEVTAKLYGPLNGNKVYEGILSDYTTNEVVLRIMDETVRIPIKSIANMVQTIKF
ncbi:ribosome maturation factor RimP [Peptoniphilus equinus]|uniref:Ribosome maturation factor RimP n=1 Tax=Peptoniphilus equinus TaxID=3016343 RepID=A0ABY7QV59_9FIRM|nr:ribosome maturation factor RimP [Peptoniphilus equinus]WBW50675.1 ribosome maturation factor RimP [Peptoniphilus equinus]